MQFLIQAEKLRDAKLHDPYLINFYQEWLKPALKNHGWRPELLSRIRVTVAFPPIISDEQKYRFVEHILKVSVYVTIVFAGEQNRSLTQLARRGCSCLICILAALK